MQESPVALAARELGIDVFTPTNAAERFDIVSQAAPDCCPVIAYGALLTADALNIPPHGWVNVHFSLLPRWRGAAPVQWAIIAGDEQTGICTFAIETGLDTGPVYDREPYPLDDQATTGSVLAELGERAGPLLLRTLNAIAAGNAQPTPQPTDGITLAPKLTPEDARIDWQLAAAVIDRRIRGCAPDPGAWTTWQGQRMRIGPAQLVEHSSAPGVVEQHGTDIVVGTAAGSLRLGDVQPAGKRMMPAADWLRGIRGATGDVVFT